MKTDFQIQKDVMEEIKWDPLLTVSEIGVAVKDGIVTLSGHVDSYYKKMAAENATKKVFGVKALAEDIQVGISPNNKRTDTEIAEAIVNALRWHSVVQEEKIKIKVEDGVVKLEGEVEWEYQRTNIKSTVARIAGVCWVNNLITVKPAIMPSDVVQKIKSAFQRSANIDASNINAEVVGSKVILTGIVRSFAEKQDAENAAWAAPGVAIVDNKLIIKQSALAYDA